MNVRVEEMVEVLTGRKTLIAMLAMGALLAATIGVPGVAGAQGERPGKAPSEPIDVGLDEEHDNADFDIAELTELEMPYWVALRADLGFDSDPAFIRRLVTTEQGIESTRETSFPLTEDEALELQRREHVLDLAVLAEGDFAQLDGYAGFYMDHLNDGTLKINFTTPLSIESSSKIQEALGNDRRVAIGVVENSLEDLERGRAALVGEMRALGLHEVGVDVVTNEVYGSVLSSRARAVPLGLARSAGLSPDSIVIRETEGDIEASSCPSRNVCGSGSADFRGGIRIKDGNASCTSGFVATDNVGNDFLITAGHCDDQTGDRDVQIGGQPHVPGIHRYIPGSNGLRDANDQWRTSSNADAVLVGIEDSKKSRHIFRTTSSKKYYMNSQQFGAPPVGRLVCIAARITNYRCGTVVDGSVTTAPTNSGYTGTITQQVKWSMNWPGYRSGGFGGSSGGPVIGHSSNLGQRRATGINSSENRIGYDGFTNITHYFMYFSTISNVEAALDVQVRLN